MIQGKLSLVLPAHNEEENIRPVVESAISTLPQHVEQFEIIIVNDGSSDRTAEIAQSLTQSDARVNLVGHEVNRGYGAALRSGFNASTGDWVMIMDSDRQFDLGDLVYLSPLVGEYDLVAGYRIQRSDPLYRTMFGKTFRIAMRILFGIQLKDIDCAFKVVNGPLLRSLPLQSSGAMISTELMARWVRIGATWTQVGVHHYPRTAGQQSGGSFAVILKAMRDVPSLWFRLNREPTLRLDGDGNSNSTGLTPANAAVIGSLVLAALIGVVVRILRHK